jgi:hypothetical protein
MKIYAHTPQILVRLQIAKQGEDTQYLTLVDTTAKEVEEFCKKVISSQKIDIFATGLRTSINIREATGGDNGKSKSISFRGLNPKQTLQLLITHINAKQK